MSRTRKRLLLVAKTVVAIALIAGVGWHFRKLLTSEDLAQHTLTLRFEYLLPAGLLYLGAHTVWGTFFVQLMRYEGAAVAWLTGVRAYFVSQFGKYVPGKAWVLLLRVMLLRRVGVHPAVVGVTATYETLTSMAAGAVLGVCLLPWTGFGDRVEEKVGPAIWFGLAAVAGLPLVLGVLNRVAARIVHKRRGPDARPLPSPSVGLLARGLLQDSLGWCLLGLSLWATVQGVAPRPAGLGGDAFLQCLAAVTVSYVAGFVIVVSPGGLGAREAVLLILLTGPLRETAGEALAAPLAAVVAIVLRLVWTAFEVGWALMLYWLARPARVRHVAPVPVAADGGGHV
ncbi:MAG TPA: lysylphosphatidylglycerol synthase domain-containing protein [Fimbriiglobus sp.]|nr:lysylphosphatidylglycerol synthase domain-containing protein [Fimbriiglobus sp.]